MFKRLIASSLIIRNVTHVNYSKAFLLSLTDNISKDDPNKQQGIESKVGRKNAQKKLTELLGIKAIKALEIVTTYKTFAKIPCSLLSENHKLCTVHKLHKDVLLKFPYILTEPDLLKKIELINMLSVKLVNSIPLVKLTLRKLNIICLQTIETTTRIYDLCRIFDVTPSQSCEILATKPFLFSLNLNHLEGHLKLFLEHGASKESLLKDMWVFKYSEQYIKNRLQCIKAQRVETLKPWMIRCPEETLYRHIKRELDNKDILGDNSVAEYLSDRLKCSESIAKYLIRKQPALQTKSLLKMNEMIDFLYMHGFTPSQICRVPKVLLHSTKTAKNRMKELEALGHKPDSLYVLTKSQKLYMQHIETLIKTKTKAASSLK